MNENKELLEHFENSRRLEKEKEIALTKLKEKITEKTKKYAVMIIAEQIALLKHIKKETQKILNIEKKEKILEILNTLEKEYKKEKIIIETELLSILKNKKSLLQKDLISLKENINKATHIDYKKYGLPGIILTIQRLQQEPKTEIKLPERQELTIRISELFVPSKILKALLITIDKNNINQTKHSIYLEKDYLEKNNAKNEFLRRLEALDLKEEDIQKYIKLAETKGAILLDETLIQNRNLLEELLKKERFSRFLDLMHPEGKQHLRNTAKTIMQKLLIIEDELIEEPLKFYKSKHFNEEMMRYFEQNHKEAHKIIQNLKEETEK